MILKHRIGILKWFLKDHVTLTTVVLYSMAADCLVKIKRCQYFSILLFFCIKETNKKIYTKFCYGSVYTDNI